MEDDDQQKAPHMRVYGNMIGAGFSDEDDDDLDEEDDDVDDIMDIPSENGDEELELTNGFEKREAEEIENFNPEAQNEMVSIAFINDKLVMHLIFRIPKKNKMLLMKIFNFKKVLILSFLTICFLNLDYFCNVVAY